MTERKRYFGGFGDLSSMLTAFRDAVDVEAKRGPVPVDTEVLFASYGGAAYEGDAVVIFEKCGTLYEVHGGHCSCNGLEGQWDPSPVTWPALAMRLPEMAAGAGFLGDHEEDAQQAFVALVRERTTPPTGG